MVWGRRGRGAGPTDDMAEIFRRIAKGNVPDDAAQYVDGAYSIALELYAVGDPDEIIDLADRMIGGPGGRTLGDFMVAKAEALRRAGMDGEALECAEEAEKLGGVGNLSQRIAGDVARSRGDLEGALAHYEASAGNDEGRSLSATLMRRAAVLLELGRHEECIKAAGEAIVAVGDEGGVVRRAAAAAELRAGAESGLGRHADALRSAELGLDGDPGSAALEARRAAALAGLGRYPEALAAANASIKADHAGAGAWYTKARMLARLGKPEPALDALTVAVSLDPASVMLARKEADLGPLRGDARFRRLAG